MAWPMLDWVLDRYYGCDAKPDVEEAVRVYDVRESDLVQLMDELSAGAGGAKLFSLPHMGDVPSIELGFRGERSEVQAALSRLVAALNMRELKFEQLQTKTAESALSQTAV
jgi:molybdopterin-biosynthesis enzyme MoeA-like protein